ncbi:hypothetical protein [Gordonia sp. (in: high G+C Gram-positive bacteria)]|uniref:hypothetical protein n=1 Tax=unclassified Gordonia (in: high G+C Gram-positive bacteria) TaxID=2657482 RepID=UPI0026296DA3|nr:hypothetical protein [Gordonia sp. (in: high G+C Gram-positive bacteria)]
MKINRLGRVLTATLAVAAAGAATVAGAGAADAATGTVHTGGITLNVRSAPNTTAPIVARLNDKTRVTIDCTTTGPAVKGDYGTSTIWDHIAGSGYVADAWIYTGTNNAVAPRCGGQPAPAPAPSGNREAKAVSWALSQVGSNSYNFACERFVENAYGTSGRSGSAIATFNNLRSRGMIHTSSSGIPKGALVFSSNPTYDQGYGHVMIAVGDGTYVSGGAVNGPTVQRYNRLLSTYLGWSYAPPEWGSR